MKIDTQDIENVKSLLDLMEERNLLTLELTSGDDSIKLTKYYEPVSTQTIVSHPSASVIEPKNTAPAPTTDLSKLETSPMVGVFYSAPTPNDPAFVSVGQKVSAGDQIGIVEAMKIMNPLEATKSGIIKEILVNNAEVVEFDQPIVRYES